MSRVHVMDCILKDCLHSSFKLSNFLALELSIKSPLREVGKEIIEKYMYVEREGEARRGCRHFRVSHTHGDYPAGCSRRAARLRSVAF